MELESNLRLFDASLLPDDDDIEPGKAERTENGACPVEAANEA